MIDIDTLVPGTKVKIIDEWMPLCGQNAEGLMDKYLGQIVTVFQVQGNTVLIEEDAGDCEFQAGGHWCWNAFCFECIIDDVEYEDFDISSESEILSFILN